MKMNKWLSVLASILLVASGWAEDGNWFEDFQAAKVHAEKTGKYILLNFSGSDWCIWCKRLSDEVFIQDGFINYAKDNLVLAVADFPRADKQSKKIKAQNEALLEKFKIRGFPTVLILDPEGGLVYQTGYLRGGADVYVSHVKEIIEKHQSQNK
ncbi:thioredoxin family protein [bacterium]|nr:thioredoxin family protein [bacterium]